MEGEFTRAELELIIDALARAAARYESMGNANPSGRNTRDHDATARAMRDLREKVRRIFYKQAHQTVYGRGYGR